MDKNLFLFQLMKIWLDTNFGEFSPTRTFKGHTAADKKAGKKNLWKKFNSNS